MDKTGKWTLSPAYDIGFAYNPKDSWTDTHQMSINGKFDDLTREDLLACAAANNIKNAVEMYKDETFGQCKKRWRSFLMREYLQLANILKTCLRVVKLAGST